MINYFIDICKEMGYIGVPLIVLGILLLIIWYRCNDVSKKLGLLVFPILIIIIGLILTICWII